MSEETVIQWPNRCSECGKKATRQQPDGDEFGCATCFPHWPDSPPEAAPVPPLSDDQPRVGLDEVAYLCPRCKVPHLRKRGAGGHD
jgi:hypothetical protein